MRIHILGNKKRSVAPTVIGSWEDGDGRRHIQDQHSTSLGSRTCRDRVDVRWPRRVRQGRRRWGWGRA